MALSFACQECGEQRTLNADGTADPCPSCGAGLPGETDADNDAGPQNEQEAAEAEAADDGLPGEPISREPLPSEEAAPEEVPPPPVAVPPVQISASELHEHHDEEGEAPESVDLSPKGGREEGDMDMTPMVDVTFLLLIFFMITAAFSLQKSIEVPKPKETDQASTQVQEEEEQQDPEVTVFIDQYNTFTVVTSEIEEEAPSKHDLLRKLRRARDTANPESIPNKLIVKAHGDATHERVVIALDAGVEVGMEQVQLITIEEDL